MNSTGTGTSSNGSGPFVTVYVPAFNEERSLAHTVARLSAKLNELERSYEILIVDDGSRDSTPEIAARMAAEDERIRVVTHPENRGIAATFFTALEEARGVWILYMAADLAAEPDDIGAFFTASESSGVVLGQRSRRHDSTLFREIISSGNQGLVSTLFRVPVHHFTFANMYRTELVRSLELDYPDSAFFYAEIVLKAFALGHPFVEIPVRYLPRKQGTATGARLGLVLATLRDLLRFWCIWIVTRDPGRFSKTR